MSEHSPDVEQPPLEVEDFDDETDAPEPEPAPEPTHRATPEESGTGVLSAAQRANFWDKGYRIIQSDDEWVAVKR